MTDDAEPSPAELSRRPAAGAGGRRDNSEGEAGDPLGVAAIVAGCIGIVFAGIVLAIVTAVLASIAGGRARAAGRSPEDAYLAFGLAAVDGVVWLALHLMFDVRFLWG